MVKYDQAATDRAFGALSHPLRREILARLQREPGLSIGALIAPYAITMPALHKHMAVLVDAGLVTRDKSGRTTSFAIAPDGFRTATDWLLRYELFWSTSLDRLAKLLQEDS